MSKHPAPLSSEKKLCPAICGELLGAGQAGQLINLHTISSLISQVSLKFRKKERLTL